jgi:cytochrome P450
MFEDPPAHTAHRGLMSRVFTPKRMAALEDQVRQYCAACLDPLVGSSGFDLIAELGAELPMRVIGMLLGIPESDQVSVRERTDADLRTKPGQPMKIKQERITSSDLFHEYIEWRAQHPSDDLMTVLLNAEFEDEQGDTRRLTREEVHQYTAVLAGAGNETTGRLIGWLAKVLAEHPDQRREVHADRSLLPKAIDETLRFEPTGHAVARYVVEDVELHGTTIPAGSPILLLMASANRDPRRYTDPDRFDLHRDDIQHLTFGFGLHYCLGASLARLEGRVALDELLTRFPEWDVDLAGARLAPTSTVRGWERLPIVLP